VSIVVNALPRAEAPSVRHRTDRPDIVCFCHLRWDFVYQRPQHLMSRFARERRVLFFEEPVEGPACEAHVSTRGENVTVVVPRIPAGLAPADAMDAQRALVDETLARLGVTDFVLWLQTPMALDVARHLAPRAVVYDCMDELSAFKNAPEALRLRERELLDRADVVFTGGASLYAAKRTRHPRVRLFPSSVDDAHFRPARGMNGPLPEPDDVRALPRPRIGFAGVIDERMDVDLVAAVADRRPDWQLVMLGPVVKIDPATLPQRPNVHYLGMKDYATLPAYFASWDVGMMPFAHNESTRFISPTKTLEYLAAGLPVVSTRIADVADPYGAAGVVRLGDTPDEFVDAIERTLAEPRDATRERVDAMLARTSWDATWRAMSREIDDAALEPAAAAAAGA
jgi:glycosyltransferase involved in cell wall biosynthesis